MTLVVSAKNLLALLAVALVASCAAASRPAAPPPTSPGREPLAQVELQPYRTRLRTITARVGGVTGTFLLDTASGLSIVTPAFARQIGCEPWGRISGFRMTGERLDSPRCDGIAFEVAGVTLTAPVAAVVDLMSLLPAGAAPLDGIIALDVFAGRAVTLDVARNRLWLESPGSLTARTSGMRAVDAVRIAREVQGAAVSVNVPVTTPRGTAWFELDSGNGGTILVGKHIAALLGLDDKATAPQPARFDLSGGAARIEGDVFVPDMIIDGNLGMPFLSRWVITIDLGHSRLWIAPAA